MKSVKQAEESSTSATRVGTSAMTDSNQRTAKHRMTWLPPDDLNWGFLGWYVYVSDLTVELYVQGKSLEEVADLTGRPVKEVSELTWAADVLRSIPANAVIGEQRARARAVLARLNIRFMAVRWAAGVETETLAAENAVPADLMWAALARELSRGPAYDARDRMCLRRKCSNACIGGCALKSPAGDYAPSGHGWPPGLRDNQTRAHPLPAGTCSPEVIVEQDSQRVRLRESVR